MNTQDNNKLIAEFMGITPNEAGVYHVSKHKGYDLENLNYHTSWDWLMPVVGKIKDTSYRFYRKEIDDIDNVLTCDLRIEKLYQAVVEYIKYHNKVIESDKKRLEL